MKKFYVLMFLLISLCFFKGLKGVNAENTLPVQPLAQGQNYLNHDTLVFKDGKLGTNCFITFKPNTEYAIYVSRDYINGSTALKNWNVMSYLQDSSTEINLTSGKDKLIYRGFAYTTFKTLSSGYVMQFTDFGIPGVSSFEDFERKNIRIQEVPSGSRADLVFGGFRYDYQVDGYTNLNTFTNPVILVDYKNKISMDDIVSLFYAKNNYYGNLTSDIVITNNTYDKNSAVPNHDYGFTLTVRNKSYDIKIKVLDLNGMTVVGSTSITVSLNDTYQDIVDLILSKSNVIDCDGDQYEDYEFDDSNLPNNFFTIGEYWVDMIYYDKYGQSTTIRYTIKIVDDSITDVYVLNNAIFETSTINTYSNEQIKNLIQTFLESLGYSIESVSLTYNEYSGHELIEGSYKVSYLATVLDSGEVIDNNITINVESASNMTNGGIIDSQNVKNNTHIIYIIATSTLVISVGVIFIIKNKRKKHYIKK